MKVFVVVALLSIAFHLIDAGKRSKSQDYTALNKNVVPITPFRTMDLHNNFHFEAEGGPTVHPTAGPSLPPNGEL